jgi:hypothetical protein
MSRLSESACPESSNETLTPSAFEKALIRYLLRRKGVLSLVLPLLLGGVGWGMKQMAEASASELIRKDKAAWDKVQIDSITGVKHMEKEFNALVSKTSAQQEDLLAKKAEMEDLLLKSAKIPGELEKIEKLHGVLATVKNIADLQGDVNKIIDRLVKDKDFQKALTSSVSAEIAKVAAQTNKLETTAKELAARLQAHEEQMGRLSAHPLIGGVPYRVAHVDENPNDDFITVHQASSLERPVGKVFFDPSSDRAQFFRLSTSTSHEADKDGKSVVPRCHVLFKGWLPEKALKIDKDSFREGAATMIEMKDELASEDQRLRDEPGYDQRMLAVFEGHNMPFFTTGNLQAGWVEVTFEGWMAVTNGKGSKEKGYKTYMSPALQ